MAEPTRLPSPLLLVRASQRSRLTATLLLLCMTGLTLLTLEMKLDTLSFKAKEFVTNWMRLTADRNLSPIANSEGHSLFGFTDIDVHPNLQNENTIHIAPFEELLTLIGHWSPSPTLLFGVYLLLTLAVLIHAAWVIRQGRDSNHQALMFFMACLLLPSFVPFVLNNLNVFVGFSLLTVTLMVLVASGAGLGALLAASAAGLAMREDVCLIMLLAAYLLVLDGRRRDASILYAISLAYAAFAFHHNWTMDNAQLTLIGRLAIVAAAYAVFPPFAGFFRTDWIDRLPIPSYFRGHPEWRHALLVSPFFYFFVTSLFKYVISPEKGLASNAVRVVKHVIRGPFIEPRLFPMTVGLLFILFFMKKPLFTQGWRLGRWRLGLPHLLAGLAIWTAVDTVNDWGKAAPREGLRARMTALREPVRAAPGLTVIDFFAYQVFYDLPDVFIWERLPSVMEPSTRRFYPDNLPLLIPLLREQSGQYVMATPSFRDFEPVLAEAGALDQLEICHQDEQLTIARHRRLGRCLAPPLPQ